MWMALHPAEGVAASKEHCRRPVCAGAGLLLRVPMMLWRGIFAVLILAAAALSARAATVHQQQAQPVELQPHAQLA